MSEHSSILSFFFRLQKYKNELNLAQTKKDKRIMSSHKAKYSFICKVK